MVLSQGTINNVKHVGIIQICEKKQRLKSVQSQKSSKKAEQCAKEQNR